MKHVFFLIALAAAWTIPMLAFGQTLQIVRTDGTIENIQVQVFDPRPETIRIKPYGLNLQPANIPERRSEYRPPVNSTYNPGPVTIENPYYEPPVFVEPDHLEAEVRQLGNIRYALLMLFKRIFRIP